MTLDSAHAPHCVNYAPKWTLWPDCWLQFVRPYLTVACLAFPSAFNPIRATLDVIYLFIYLFSKDVTDSYRGPKWGLLPGETVTNVQPSIRQFVLRWRVMVLVIDCVCVCARALHWSQECRHGCVFSPWTLTGFIPTCFYCLAPHGARNVYAHHVSAKCFRARGRVRTSRQMIPELTSTFEQLLGL